MTTSVGDITAELKSRKDYYQERNSRYDTLIKCWHGKYAEEYPGEFPDDELPKIANWMKLGWDSFAAMVGKVPDKIVRPGGLSDDASRRASLLEEVAYAYDEGSRIKNIHYEHAWYLVGLGSSCRGVVPNFTTRMPQFVIEDPRNVYPTPGYESTYASKADDGTSSATGNPDNFDIRGLRGGNLRDIWTGGQLEDIIIEKRATVRALKRAFKDLPQNTNALGPDTPENLKRVLPVIQYVSTSEMVTIALDRVPVVLARFGHDLGFCPWRVTQTFAPDQVGGISQFEEQIPLIIAYARILGQKLSYNDKSVWPLTWIAGDFASARVGPHEVIKLTDQSKMGQLPPPSEFQADRDLQTLDRNIRILNREGDPLRAEVSGGPITGRGLEQLLRPINTIVEHYWTLDSPDTEALYSYAFAMDEYFWPDEEKKIRGRRNGEEFESTYRPAKDINQHREITVSYGFGVGGIEGFIQMLQALGAELIDRQSVMEAMPGVKSVSSTMRRVEIDRLEKSIYAAFEGGDIPRAQFLAQVKDEVAKGTPLSEAVLKFPAPTPPEQVAQGLGGLGLPGMEGAMLGPEQQNAQLEGGGAPPLSSLLAGLGG